MRLAQAAATGTTGNRRVRTAYIGNVGTSVDGCHWWIARMGALGAKIP
jgi:hypothetical protein